MCPLSSAGPAGALSSDFYQNSQSQTLSLQPHPGVSKELEAQGTCEGSWHCPRPVGQQSEAWPGSALGCVCCSQDPALRCPFSAGTALLWGPGTVGWHGSSGPTLSSQPASDGYVHPDPIYPFPHPPQDSPRGQPAPFRPLGHAAVCHQGCWWPLCFLPRSHS